MKRLALFSVVVFLFCFGFIVPGCSQGVNSPAPEVSATTWINSSGFKIADNKDKIVIVEFWATWCPPCRQSIPHLKELNATYKDRGVVLVSLTDESAETINEFNKKAEMDWTIGAGSSSGRDYGVKGIPSAFIIVDGNIVWNDHPMNGLDNEIKKLVEEREAKAAPAAPAAPVAPAAPATTETPAVPAATEAPAAPAATETPAAPAVTETPAAPAATETPAAPAATETPAAPAATETPAAPAATEAPAAPADTATQAVPVGE